MMELNEIFKILISLAIGFVIGLERERGGERLVDKFKDSYAPLGARTFSLIAILGCLSGLMLTSYFFLTIFIATIFAFLLIIYYALHAWITRDIGITTEIALLFTFILGFLIATQALPIQISIAISVILLILLSKKDRIKDVVRSVKNNEINAFVSYAIIALLILPFLPDSSIKFLDIPLLEKILGDIGFSIQRISNTEIINPSRLWTIVALITGMDLLGHFLSRTIGQKRGWLLTSFVGGFISSTAVTLTLAGQSKQLKSVNSLVSSAIFANMASFFQIAILIGVINSAFLSKSIMVLALLMISSLACGLYFYFKKEKQSDESIESSSKPLAEKPIINLVPALKFALIFLIIRLFSKISLEFFGTSGFLITSGIGALSGLDAVLINASEMVGKNIDYSIGLWALIIANGVNLVSKSIYSFMQGSRVFAVKFSSALFIIIMASIIGLMIS